MLVFNNQQKSGYEEIAAYGPRYYLNIKEMDAIYRFAGITLDMMAGDLEIFMGYQFISHMNEENLIRMEQFLGILSDQERSLEERVKVVQASWNSPGKISKSKISDIIKCFTDNTCTIELVDSQIKIDMTFTGSPQHYMPDIRNFINKLIPAHLGVVYKGLTDIIITVKWINTVIIKKIQYKMTFNLYKQYNRLYFKGRGKFNGIWHFDGQPLIKNDTKLFPFLMTNKFTCHNEEHIKTVLITKHNECHFDGKIRFNESKKFDTYIKTEEL